MAGFKETPIPTDERLKVRAHFREGLAHIERGSLEDIKFIHSAWARRLADAQPLTTSSQYEQGRERKENYNKVHDYIRTHLKKDDRYFTCDTLIQLWTWFTAAIEIHIGDIDRNVGNQGESLRSKAKSRQNLLDYSAWWDERLLELAPSFEEWYERNNIELLVSRDHAVRLATFLARSLWIRRLIRQGDIPAVTDAIQEAIKINASDMASQFLRSWGEYVALLELDNHEPVDSLFAVTQKLRRDWQATQGQRDRRLRITVDPLSMTKVLQGDLGRMPKGPRPRKRRV